MKRNPHFKANFAKLAPLTLEQQVELARIEREAIANFFGSFDDLEGALGMLRLGHHLGWRVLVLIHNKRTIRKYEGILGIQIRKLFPPEGPSAKRSLGYTLALQIGNFWKAVSGAIPITNRREIAEQLPKEA